MKNRETKEITPQKTGGNALILSFSLYLLLGIFVSLPVVLNLHRELIGHFGTGEQDFLTLLYFLWKMYMHDVYSASFASGAGPASIFTFITEAARFPLLIDIGSCFPFYFMYFLEKIFPFPAFYNVFSVTVLILNGFCLYILMRYLAKNETAAWCSGAIFMLAPYLFNHYTQLRIEQFNMFCIPLFVLYMIKLFEENENKIKNGVLCGLFLGLTSLFYWYYGMFMVFFAFMYLAWYLIREYKKGIEWKKLIFILPAAAVFFLIILPAAGPYISILFSSKEPVPGKPLDGGYFTPDNVKHPMQRNIIRYSMPLESLFDMRHQYAIPVAVLIPGLLSLIFYRKIPPVWFAGFVLFYLLTLGPYLHMGRELATPHIRLFWYEILYRYVPFFARFQWPSRVYSMVLFFMTVLAGFSLKELFEYIGAGRKYIPVILSVIMVAIGVFQLQRIKYYPVQTSEPAIPRSFMEIGERNRSVEAGLEIIHLPFSEPSLGEGRFDGHLVYDGYNMDYLRLMRVFYIRDFISHIRFRYIPAMKDNTFLQYLVEISWGRNPSPDMIRKRDFEEIMNLDCGYIALHESMFSQRYNQSGLEGDFDNIARKLELLLGPPEFMDYEVRWPKIIGDRTVGSDQSRFRLFIYRIPNSLKIATEPKD